MAQAPPGPLRWTVGALTADARHRHRALVGASASVLVRRRRAGVHSSDGARSGGSLVLAVAPASGQSGVGPALRGGGGVSGSVVDAASAVGTMGTVDTTSTATTGPWAGPDIGGSEVHPAAVVPVGEM